MLPPGPKWLFILGVNSLYLRVTVIIRLDQTVAELKKHLTTVVQLSTNSMRLYYIDKNSPFGPEELKYNTLALHSYSIQDGDEILVVRKTK